MWIFCISLSANSFEHTKFSIFKPKCSAIFLAYFDSSKLENSKPILKHLISLEFFEIRLVIKLESIPPDRNVPIGTSEICCIFVELRRVSLSLSFASSFESLFFSIDGSSHQALISILL